MQLRQDDEVARIGGDEFIAVWPKIATQNSAHKVASSIRSAIKEPIQLGDQHHYLDVSTGVVVVDHRSYIDQPTIIALADKAMYKAKRDGTHIAFSETCYFKSAKRI